MYEYMFTTFHKYIFKQLFIMHIYSSHVTCKPKRDNRVSYVSYIMAISATPLQGAAGTLGPRREGRAGLGIDRQESLAEVQPTWGSVWVSDWWMVDVAMSKKTHVGIYVYINRYYRCVYICVCVICCCVYIQVDMTHDVTHE